VRDRHLFPDFRTNTFEDFATVRNRRLSALYRRRHTKEEDFQRPGVLVRILVMKKYALASRVIGEGIDIVADLRARRRALGIL